MKITKYPQSCLLLDNGDGRILIDPGNLAMDAFTLDDFGHVDAVLYTHRHADHFDERHVAAIVDRGIALFANEDTAALIDGGSVATVADGDNFEVAGFDVTARELPHMPMVDGSAGPPNTGYLVEGTFFHPGDGIELPGLEVDHLAVNLAGPSTSFRDAYAFTKATGASKVVPVHYDFFVAKPEQFAHFCDIAEVVIIEPGSTATL